MKSTSALAPALLAAFLAAAIVPAHAQQAKGHAKSKGVEGQVASVTGSGFVMENRKDQTNITVTTGPSTVYALSSASAATSLASGDNVFVVGRVPKAGSTIDARQILVFPADTTGGGGLLQAEEAHARGVAGTIASAAPNLTVTSEGATFTVATTNLKHVTDLTPGSAADIVAGARVHVFSDSPIDGATSITADSVVVSQKRGRLGGKKAGRRARANRAAVGSGVQLMPQQ